MRLIKSSFEILEQEPGLDGIYKQIEKAGRTCYRSQDKITEDSAKKFVDMLINRGHTAVLEHGTIYLKAKVLLSLDVNGDEVKEGKLLKYLTNPYSRIVLDNGIAYVTTNYRVLYENDWLEDIDYLCEPTEHHVKRIAVRVNCSIGISREWNRHRKFSICEQSTRYCNYSKDKFNNELTFVIPSWIETIEPGNYNKDHKFPPMWGHDYWMESIWFYNMCEAEEAYMDMVREYLIPQQSREVLPLSTATEVIYTGFVDDWRHFFKLRCDNAAHPDMRALTVPLKGEFINRNYI